MKTKDEVIAAAWIEAVGSETYHILKPYIGDEGYCGINIFSLLTPYKKFPSESFETNNAKNQYYRPISLRGIEENNGWTRIESESDLPKDENKKYLTGLLLDSDNLPAKYWKQDSEEYDCAEVQSYFYSRIITHYRVIEPFDKPHF